MIKTIAKDLAAWAAVWAAAVILFTQVLTLNYIPSASMEGTIKTGDLLIATRYDRTDIDRYDIMTFFPPDEPDTLYIKRVIGLPGETITVKDGMVYADGEALDQSLIPEKQESVGDGVYQVPEGCYFMLGDNRNHSLDARFWDEKYVPLKNMMAKAQVIVFPFSRAGSLAYDGAA